MRGLGQQGYAIAGQIGRHRVSVMNDGCAIDPGVADEMVAAAFRRVVERRARLASHGGSDARQTPDAFPALVWAPDRWRNIARTYTPADVARLPAAADRATLPQTAPGACGNCSPRTLCRRLAQVHTGNQAVQQVKAGLKAIYLSGWY